MKLTIEIDVEAGPDTGELNWQSFMYERLSNLSRTILHDRRGMQSGLAQPIYGSTGRQIGRWQITER